MKCNNCKKDVKELHSLYEEQPYNETKLTTKALNKLVNKGSLWLCESCLRKAKQ